MTLLERVSALLDRAGVPHALIGAAALASAGVARSTFDIDLLVVSDVVLRESAWAALAEADVVLEADSSQRAPFAIERGNSEFDFVLPIFDNSSSIASTGDSGVHAA